MKAKELIEVLQKLDPNTLVVLDGYEGDYCVIQGAERVHVSGPHKAVPWYYGDYKYCPEDEPEAIEAIYLIK